MRLSTKYPFDDIKIEGINIINNELNIYKKKSRWNVNFGLGYGTYPINGSVKITPFVGVMLGDSLPSLVTSFGILLIVLAGIMVARGK